jgi:hypothetical protein
MIVAYLLTWLVGVALSVLDDSHTISKEISGFSWRFFSAASVANIAILWIASLAVFFRFRWSAGLFFVNVAYALTYVLVFGEGSGSKGAMVIGTIHTMLAGAILFALLSAPGREERI